MYIVLILSTVAAWGMVGLIWLIQIVHYPMLALYSEAIPASAAETHARLISPVVGPLMATEGLTALVLLLAPPEGVSWLVLFAAAAFLGVALLSTIVFSVPQHAALAKGKDPDAAQTLIRTNWIRTLAWTARGLLLVFALIQGSS